ncbi:putative RING finger protein P8B7.15c [Pseudocercospora fuligena]|uniref:Putative RING finger protein P8B7.15c n=1 Tax=Pseudocercospora fuligena TaxID=685502 RepID=A0A8H6RU20_9PEZI|nr:putative RING finger protein P8B7.15c [Pseudocercospora fuligena]
MSSSIFFRFKSSKEPMQINFDGTSLSVFEVKREIINISRFGDGKDFDLIISASDSSEVYDDDTTQIPRSTTVIAQRRPASKPGAGRAARYVTGQMPSYAKNQHRVEKGVIGKSTPVGGAAIDTSNMTEEEKLQAVMNASNTQLKADLESSASVPVKRGNYKAAVPDKPLPPGYVCYRCRQRGHWIQACPTNNDPTFDGKKPKRTTGIPRSMLEKIEEPDTTKELPQGVFMTNDGDYVRVKTDEATWQKLQEQQKATAEKAKELAQGDEELRERGLECMLDKRPFVNPVQTPCCHMTYCQDCIENALLDNDLICPNCGEQALLDKLEPDDKKVKELADYEKEKKTEKQQKEKEKSKTPEPSKPADTKLPPANGTQAKTNGTGSPSSSNSKKRGAEEELENKRRPSNPAEMKKVASNQGTPAPGAKSAAPKPEPPKGPKAMTGGTTTTGNTEIDYKNLMKSMSAAQGQTGMNAMMNPMMMNGGMGFPGMSMGMGMPAMGMGMPGMPFPNMNMMNNMGGFPGMGMNMNGMGMMPQQQWLNGGGPQQQQRNGPPTGPAADQQNGAYFRQPVNPHRHQNKGRRQRSVDYKQM